ncbi:hypothetical protein, partial [Escherichia coli]|uniref:hypothetical protein n=1 Tax=Escherichia coli TaxID=562 RepID=UPI001AA1CFEB
FNIMLVDYPLNGDQYHKIQHPKPLGPWDGESELSLNCHYLEPRDKTRVSNTREREANCKREDQINR